MLSNIIKRKAPKFGKYVIRLSIKPQACIELYLFVEPKKPLLPVIDLIINHVDLSDKFKSKDRQEIFYILEKEGFAELDLNYETIQLIYKRLSDEPIHKCLWRKCSNPAKDGKAFCSSRCRWKMKQSLIHANKGKEPDVLDSKGNKIPLTKFLEEEYIQQVNIASPDELLGAKDDFWRNSVPSLEKEYGVRIRANPVGRPKKKN